MEAFYLRFSLLTHYVTALLNNIAHNPLPNNVDREALVVFVGVK